MGYSIEDLRRDVERVRRIPIVTTLLNVICETTGMGFAAVARVTEDRWVTCSVRDDIQFGLVPGSELKIETTICNDIRDSREAVVINNVDESEHFRQHHTPQLYGFKSYISFPIVLQSGEFFGTICAIDPKPRNVENSTTVGMFAAFAELIAFHLEQANLLEHSGETLRELNRDLINSRDENRQYQHISSHTLQEPLRKLRVFSGLLINSLKERDFEKAELLALRIDKGAERFSNLIRDLTAFSNLNADFEGSRPTDLNDIIDTVTEKLGKRLDEKAAKLEVGELPTLKVIPDQIERLFFHLFDNAIKFSKVRMPLNISVSAREYHPSHENQQLLPERTYTEISVVDNGVGIESSQLDRIFDVFSRLPTEIFVEGVGTGLSLCRKVVRNHFGQITISSELGKGTTVFVILPVN